MVARVIHGASGARGRAFVAFNCTAVPKDLADSHLFGHRRGVHRRRRRSAGVIRAAAAARLPGRIGDLGLDVQPKLLRFWSRGRSSRSRVAPAESRRAHHRLDNRHLDELVAEGLFRADLFYRLNVVPSACRRSGSDAKRSRRWRALPHPRGREFGKDRLRLSEERWSTWCSIAGRAM